MTALNQKVYTEATPEGLVGPIQSAPMSEKLIRRERLLLVLEARGVEDGKRSRFLFDLGVLSEKGTPISQQYWSNLIGQASKSFGDKTARKLEKKLEVAPYTLEEDGLAPDAATIGAAFNALPVTSPEELEMRQRIYHSIMAMLQARGAIEPKSP
jgi:hypothetical protein